MSKEQAKTTTKQSTRCISVRLLMQWEIYWRVKKDDSYTMHRTSTGQHEWKMGIISGYRTYKRMPWTIRLDASENSTHFIIHLRKENPRGAQNKQAKNN